MHAPRARPALRARPFVRFLALGPLGLSLGAAQYELLWMLNPLSTFRAGSTWVISHDDTAARILELRPHRTHVEVFPGNIPVARQRGAQLAQTSWLLFTDVDVAFDPEYFDRLRDLDVPADCAGIVGTKRTRDRFRTYYALFTLGQRLCAWVGIPPASGSNMRLRRDALLACGGFDATLSVNEDSEVMWRCQRAGHRSPVASGREAAVA